jgi:ribosomal protein L11 methyltransferase
VKYYEFTITVPDESREAVTNRLSEIGSVGTFEREEKIIAYFEDSGQIDRICEELAGFKDALSSAGLDPSLSFDFVLLPEQDWTETWKETFTPIDVANNFTVIPSWVEHETARIPIIIDPGMVFGTGHHASTQICLTLIEKYAAKVSRGTFLDIGTGSGILAIGAARLGFRKVVAVDTDPLAVDNAQRNAELNGLEKMTVLKGDVTAAEGQFDLITANLISNVLITIAREIVSRMSPGSIAILSGMLPGQEDAVLETYQRARLDMIEKVAAGNWITLALKKTVNSE